MTNTPASIAAALSEGERDRLLWGRTDWRDADWQDHCGDPNCENCEGALIPDPNPRWLSVEDAAVREILKGQA